MMRGIADIHAKNIVHRDIKPENIFIDPINETLKIGDFGLVRFMEGEFSEGCAPQSSYPELRHCGSAETFASETSTKGNKVGTAYYMAPEGGGRCNEKADIYSASVILLELLCPPFATTMEAVSLLTEFRELLRIPSFIKQKLPWWHQLILQMGSSSPDHRPSAEKVFSLVTEWLIRKASPPFEMLRHDSFGGVI